jgi:hypothetical protein
MESSVDAVASFPAGGAIRACRARKILGERNFLTGVPQMVKSRVRGDSARPGAEITFWLESVSMLVDTPEGFHGQILGDAGVADDSDNPGIDFLLVLPEQHLEGFQVACREAFQQFHQDSLYLVTG